MNRELSTSDRRVERGSSWWWALSCVLSGLTALALSGAGLVDATVVEALPDQLDAADLTVRPDPDRERLARVTPIPCPVYPGSCLSAPPAPVPAPVSPVTPPATPAPAADITCSVSAVSATWTNTGSGYRVSYGSADCLSQALPAASRVDAPTVSVLKFENDESVSFFHLFDQTEATGYVGQTFTASFIGTLPSGQSVSIDISGRIDGTP